jgi:hypothetical protein
MSSMKILSVSEFCVFVTKNTNTQHSKSEYKIFKKYQYPILHSTTHTHTQRERERERERENNIVLYLPTSHYSLAVVNFTGTI